MSLDPELPAILGGAPIRRTGPPRWPPLRPDVRAAMDEAWSAGWWGAYHGPVSQVLRDELSAYFGAEHIELVCSGTFAVELALRSLQLAAGDEVILAAYDYVGNFHDIVLLGGLPVLVDLAPDNWNLDPQRIRSAIGPKTRGIIVSHLHGGLVPMAAVMEIAREARLWVIEDAAQATGATIDGRRAGTWGDVGVISFGGSKLLSAGRGGAMLANRADVAQRAKIYCQRGNHAFAMTELQAAIVRPQLATLDADNQRRASAVEYLQREIAILPSLAIGNAAGESSPAFYKLGLKYDTTALGGLPIDRFADSIRAEGVALDCGFRAMHRTHSARRFRSANPLPVADQADDRMLVLHHPVLLGDANDVQQIVQAVEKVVRYADKIAEVPM